MPSSPRPILDRNRLNFSWLIKLRWWSIAGQSATILSVYWFLGVEVPLLPLFSLVGIEIASNVFCTLLLKRRLRVPEWHLAAIMAADIGLLTALLFLTGGPYNPFSFLYLVNIALAAVVLRAQWTWALAALALICFGLLPLLDFRELPIRGSLSEIESVHLHQRGTWVAFGVAAGFIVHFLWRVTSALGARERELSSARKEAARKERLASLATMAAGAAHELATPLGTIALVAKELEREMERAGQSGEAIEDVRLIRAQVARCRLILDQMAVGVGKSAEQSVEAVTVGALLDEVLSGVRAVPPVHVDLAPEAARSMLRLPPRAMAQALRSLVTNAQDASPPRVAVEVRATVDGESLHVEVRDRGTGIPPEILDHVYEPFFTTKEPGSGMGLGLFLTRAVIERLGGSLVLDSVSTQGTSARVIVPISTQGLLDVDSPSSSD